MIFVEEAAMPDVDRSYTLVRVKHGSEGEPGRESISIPCVTSKVVVLDSFDVFNAKLRFRGSDWEECVRLGQRILARRGEK